MSLNSFGMVNSLVAILNGRTDGSNRAIASYLAGQIHAIDDVTVQMIIDGAFVSRSAVRRFCNQLGYSSWNDLKASFSLNVFPSDLRHRDLTLALEDYRQSLDEQIARIVRDMREHVSSEVVRSLARLISVHSNVAIVCPSNTMGVLVRFQEEMLFAGRSIELISDVYSAWDPINPMGEALVMVVSVTGGFAQEADDLVRELPGKKVLVTANASAPATDTYDEVFCVSGEERNLDELGAFGKYGITYFFDLLSACYINEFYEGERVG